MRVVVIGGTGHIGTYLVPRLVEAGHDVVSVSRGHRDPYLPDAAWESVERVAIDRDAAEEAGTFGERIRDLDPDAVVDLLCFDVDQARHLVEALRGEVQQLLHCGTIWVHGHSVSVPTTEDEARDPFGDYGVNKHRVERYLLDEARRNGFPASVLHPGHIVGEGWAPLNPAGHFDPGVFETLARGETLTLPNLGLETVHHVHADDVAQAFERALHDWNAAVGENFHVVSPKALTLRGYAEAAASWFGREADLAFVPFEEFRETVTESQAESAWSHVSHSPNCSIEKARRLLDYEPRYTSLRATRESVAWLAAHGDLDLGEADLVAR